jgi:hypothetical protein
MKGFQREHTNVRRAAFVYQGSGVREHGQKWRDEERQRQVMQGLHRHNLRRS